MASRRHRRLADVVKGMQDLPSARDLRLDSDADVIIIGGELHGLTISTLAGPAPCLSQILAPTFATTRAPSRSIMSANNHDPPTANTPLNALTLCDLPSEVIQQILYYVPPPSLAAALQTSKKLRALAQEPLLWRYSCRALFVHWDQRHDFTHKLAQPAADVDWQAILTERWRTTRRVRHMLGEIVASQQKRIEKMEAIGGAAYDAKDYLLQSSNTPKDTDDWLARRWWSEAALSLIQRRMALDIWTKVARKDPSVTLEQALGAFDVFTLGTRSGDFDDIKTVLDTLAAKLREEQPEIDEWPTRRKALALVTFLRANGFAGVENEAEHYHDIQNNYIGYALLDEKHQTLPLILAAIFICLAQRFSIDAHASNVPMHIFGLVNAPEGQTLDGEPSQPDGRNQQMFIDPFHHDKEVSTADVQNHLMRIGVPNDSFEEYTNVASTQDLVLRTARNIMTSAQTARERDMADGHAGGSIGASWATYTPPLDESFYAALWAFLIVQTMPTDVAEPFHAAHLAARRARMMPLLLENMQSNCPWDVYLLEDFVLPMFLHGAELDSNGLVYVGHRQGVRRMSADKEHLIDMLRAIRTEDSIRKPPQQRPKPPPSDLQMQQQRDDPRSWADWIGQRFAVETGAHPNGLEKVRYRIGTVFRHQRYDYEGVIVGWDTKCEKDEGWISQMGVNRLSGGKEQSFYHVLAADKSARYVAEENIGPISSRPSKALMMLAGRYFKRWDAEAGRFISNIRDEYPDD